VETCQANFPLQHAINETDCRHQEAGVICYFTETVSLSFEETLRTDLDLRKTT
jgi:hypothetical protein